MSRIREPCGVARVAGIGEILWDLLPNGRVLGGAPANFAYHAAQLGAAAAVISRVGDDAPGGEIVGQMSARGVDTEFVGRDALHPTGTVSVTVDNRGQPTYVIHEDVAWDFIDATDAARTYIRSVHAVCFGTLAQRAPRSRDTIRDLLEAVPDESLKVFDVNLRQHYYSPEILEVSLSAANVVKLSDEELPVIAAMFGLAAGAVECLEDLVRKFRLRLAALTRGAAGSVLWADGKVSDHAGVSVRVRDTVGAGDSFTAAVVMGLLAGHALDRINDQANRVAAWVCSHDGAAPLLPPEFCRPFEPQAGES